MTTIRTTFVAFAIEDRRQCDFLNGQGLYPRAPFEFINMSVKQNYDSEWKQKVRARIKGSHGVIALVSRNSLLFSGQKWEIECAKSEGKPIRGAWTYSEDQTILAGVNIEAWNDSNISAFIDTL